MKETATSFKFMLLFLSKSFGIFKKNHLAHFTILLLSFALMPLEPIVAQDSSRDSLAENHYVIIDTILYQGQVKSKGYVLKREVLFKENTIYQSKDLNTMAQQSKNLLINTNLFITAEVMWVETRYKHVTVTVVVSEKWYFWPIPVFELADRNFKQWANLDYKLNRTNYGLYLFKYNFRGRNETLKLAFINGYTRHYELQYVVPFLDSSGKYGLDLASSFKQNKELWYLTKNDSLQFFNNFDKNLIQRFENRIAFTSRRNNFSTERWELEFNNIRIKDTNRVARLNPQFLMGAKQQNEIFIKHILTYEKRDNKYYPLKGFYFKNEVNLGSIRGDTGSIEIIRETAEMGVYRELRKKLYLSFFLKGKISNEALPYIPYYNYKAFGYKDFVRGYEQYVMDGHAFLLAKLNLRYAIVHQYMMRMPVKAKGKVIKIPSGLYLNLYSDWGKAYNNQYAYFRTGINAFYQNNKLINTDLVGYGVGLDLLFLNDKIFRFEYSLNILGDKNFNLHFQKPF